MATENLKATTEDRSHREALVNKADDILVYAHEERSAGKPARIVVQVYARDNPKALRRRSSWRNVLETSVKKPVF
jgi:hypothetical protein